MPSRNSCPNIGGLQSQCRTIIECAAWYDLVLTTHGTTCTLHDGKSHGSCCPALPRNSIFTSLYYVTNKLVKLNPFNVILGHKGKSFEEVTFAPNHNRVLQSNIQSQLAAAHLASLSLFQSLGKTEKQLIANDVVVLPGSVSGKYSLFFHTTHETQKINLEALVNVYASKELANR